MARVDWPDNETLKEWYEREGLSYRDIADRVGCSKSAVGERIRAIDSVSPDDGNNLSPEQRAENARVHDYPSSGTIRGWYHDEGLTVREVAERVGCSEETMRRHMDEVGVSRRESPALDSDVDWPDAQQLRRWYTRDEMSVSEIADRVGCSPSAVSQKLDELGVDTAEFRGLVGRELSQRDRKFLRYTRWALGETQRAFADRLGVPPPTYQHWEGGRTNIHPSHLDAFESILRLGRHHGVSPDRPRRQIYWRSFVRLLEDLRVELDEGTLYDLSESLGFDPKTIPRWVRGSHRPQVTSHKHVREVAELHGVWSPPDRVETQDVQDENEPPEPDLSEGDRERIRDLSETTSISEIAMMYDLHMSTVSDIIREED